MRKRGEGERPMIAWYGKLFYGAGTLSYAVVSQMMLGLMMLFATDAHNVPPYLAGLVMAAGFAVSAFADPYAGYISGRTKSVMFGKRFAYILGGIFLTAFFNILLWAMPVNMGTALKFLWLFMFTVVLSAIISGFSVPYNALSDELSGDLSERAVIENCKKVFFLAALAVPTLLLGFLIRDTKDPTGYANLAAVNSCIVIAAGLFMFFSTYAHLPRLSAKYALKENPKLKFKEIYYSFFDGLKERASRNIILGYTASMMSAAFLMSAGLHFLIYTMGLSTAAVAGALSALFFFMIASQPLWQKLSKTHEKKFLILVGTVAALIGILIICVVFAVFRYARAGGTPLPYIIIAMAVIGAGSGAMHTVPSLMLAGISGGENPAGNKHGHLQLMSFMFKAAQGAVMLLCGALMSIFGFSGSKPVQSSLTVSAIGWIVILGASLTLGAAVYFYTASGKDKMPRKAEPAAVENEAGGAEKEKERLPEDTIVPAGGSKGAEE